MNIVPHQSSDNPTILRQHFVNNGNVCKLVERLPLNTPIKSDHVRFVCVSDTHEKFDQIMSQIPDGDVFVYAGDFTNAGQIEQVIKFNDQIGYLPHRHKLVIAGNHELGFEDDEIIDEDKANRKYTCNTRAYQLLDKCTYLCDQMISVYGIRVYGTPWHCVPGFSFYRSRGQSILDKWMAIPIDDKIDVLITHCPPFGYGDYNTKNSINLGCWELLNVIEQRIRPKYHIFGHVHEQNGLTTNGTTTFINASICNHQLDAVNCPIIFDLPLPMGQTK